MSYQQEVGKNRNSKSAFLTTEILWSTSHPFQRKLFQFVFSVFFLQDPKGCCQASEVTRGLRTGARNQLSRKLLDCKTIFIVQFQENLMQSILFHCQVTTCKTALFQKPSCKTKSHRCAPSIRAYCTKPISFSKCIDNMVCLDFAFYRPLQLEWTTSRSCWLVSTSVD